jgi:hypothetical protein
MLSEVVFTKRQLAIIAQGKKMLSILSLKCEQANYVHMGDVEKKEASF